MVRDFLTVGECDTLDLLIDRLVAARASLPHPGEARVRFTGDDVFGRGVSICFLRPQTREEAECDSRYEDAYLQSLLGRLARLKEEAATSDGYAPAPRPVRMAA